MLDYLKDNSLPKSLVLRSKKDIREIFENGTYKRLKIVTLVYMKTELQKAGFFVTKRHGNAVRRNKVKRWLREIYRTNKDKFSGYSIVFLVNKPIQFDFNDLSLDILNRDLNL